jgi:RNA-directed DNA polymerase
MGRERFKWQPHENLRTEAGRRDGPGRCREEAAVMAGERRPWITQLSKQVNQQWEEPVDKAKPCAISKHAVWRAYQKVKANQGAAGVDAESITDFKGNSRGAS